MRTDYFTKVENKYIFNLSLIFWHLFILMGTLVIIGAIFLLAYSLSPTFKASVDKAVYPPEVEVTLADLDLRDPEPVQERQQTTTQQPRPQAKPQTRPVETGLSTAGYNDYFSALDSLKGLLPNSLNEWEAIYEIRITDRMRYEYFNRDPKYTERILISDGIQGWLDKTFEKVKTPSYMERALLLRAYYGILRKINDEGNRRAALNSLQETAAKQGNVPTALNRLSILQRLAVSIPMNDSIYRQQPLWLMDRFCNEQGACEGVMQLVEQHIGKFDRKQQVPVFYSFMTNNRMLGDISLQSELTGKYVQLLPKIPAHKQAEGLDQYYAAHVRKNAERQRQIAEIESDYKRQLQMAELNYSRKKSAKDEYRLKSLMAGASGVAFISVLAILLVFLSIQRSVRKIEVRLDTKESAATESTPDNTASTL